jgi:hypothetical protein
MSPIDLSSRIYVASRDGIASTYQWFMTNGIQQPAGAMALSQAAK